MGDRPRDRRSDSQLADAMVQPDDTTPGSEFDWSDLLAVLVVAALLVLAVWYVVIGMGPIQ